MWIIEEILKTLVDWPLGTVIGILIIICVIIVVGLIGYVAYLAIDSWWRPIIGGYGKIIDKEYTPAHTQMIMIYNAATKTSTPHIQHIPDDWNLSVRINENIGNISVSENTFEGAKLEQNVFVKYKNGRLNKDNVYLTEIAF